MEKKTKLMVNLGASSGGGGGGSSGGSHCYTFRIRTRNSSAETSSTLYFKITYFTDDNNITDLTSLISDIKLKYNATYPLYVYRPCDDNNLNDDARLDYIVPESNKIRGMVRWFTYSLDTSTNTISRTNTLGYYSGTIALDGSIRKIY